MMLQRGAKRIFEWLKERRAGELYDRAVIEEAAGWEPKSLTTYLGKNKLAPFLHVMSDGKMKVLLNGSDISEQYFYETFTQKGPDTISLSSGIKARGQNGQYVLLDPRGRGAIGHVWSGHIEGSRKDDRVALKVMIPREDLLSASKISDVRVRFRREAKNGATLNDPHVLRHLDYGDIGGNPFLVMELADESVAAQLEARGPLPEELVRKIVRSCVAGLRYLHGHGCVHRDIKPSNILRFGDEYKVGDLGIVKWTDFDEAITKGGTVTRASMQLGSWFYMAPEQQADPHEATAASDIYALGISWIEMLTKILPPPHAIHARAYALPSMAPAERDIIAAMLSYYERDRPSLDDIEKAVEK